MPTDKAAQSAQGEHESSNGATVVLYHLFPCSYANTMPVPQLWNPVVPEDVCVELMLATYSPHVRPAHDSSVTVPAASLTCLPNSSKLRYNREARLETRRTLPATPLLLREVWPDLVKEANEMRVGTS